MDSYRVEKPERFGGLGLRGLQNVPRVDLRGRPARLCEHALGSLGEGGPPVPSQSNREPSLNVILRTAYVLPIERTPAYTADTRGTASRRFPRKNSHTGLRRTRSECPTPSS